MADDIGVEGLGCYGGISYATPALNKLAVVWHTAHTEADTGRSPNFSVYFGGCGFGRFGQGCSKGNLPPRQSPLAACFSSAYFLAKSITASVLRST